MMGRSQGQSARGLPPAEGGMRKGVFKAEPQAFGWVWLMVDALAVAPLTVIETAKLLRKHFRNAPSPHRAVA